MYPTRFDYTVTRSYIDEDDQIKTTKQMGTLGPPFRGNTIELECGDGTGDASCVRTMGLRVLSESATKFQRKEFLQKIHELNKLKPSNPLLKDV